MPSRDVGGRTLFPLQHLGFLDFVNGGETDGRVPLAPGGEGVFPDELPLGMVQKDAFVVHHPAITGAAGTDVGAVVAGELGQVDLKQHHPVQVAGGPGVRLVHTLFVHRGGHDHEGRLVIAIRLQDNLPLVNLPPVGRVPGPDHLGRLAEIFLPQARAASVQQIGLVSLAAGKVNALNRHHAHFGELIEADFHAVGPGHVLQVLDGRGIGQDAQLPPQKPQAVLDLPGGGFGQNELLLLEVVGDDLLGALQGENPQDEGHGQQHDHQDAQARQQPSKNDFLHGHSRAS